MGETAYAVVDMETTGLSASLDVPLELGIKLIDVVGNVNAEASWLVWEGTDEFHAGVSRGRANDFVDGMHLASGLWRDLAYLRGSDLPKTSREAVDEAICDFLHDNEVRWGTLGMMGNSIGSLDRPFTLIHFPKLNEALGHRNIDMSTFKEVMKRTNPDLFEALKPIVGTKEDAPHRVMGDIDACIREYQAYLREFLLTDLDLES